MKVAEDLVKAEKGDLSVDVGSTIQSVLEAVTLNTLALQTMDQLRRDKFLTILPHNLKGLAEQPKGSHDHLFGDIKERQVEAKAKAEVVASLMPKPQDAPCLACLPIIVNGQRQQLVVPLRPEATLTPADRQKTGRASPSTNIPWGSNDTDGENINRKTHGKSLFLSHLFHPWFGESQAGVLV